MKRILIVISLIVSLGTQGQDFVVEKAKFNTSYVEYCAGLMEGAVIYSSNRKSEVMVTYLDEEDNFYSNLYVASEKNGKALSEQRLFSKEISSALNEGSLSFMPDRKSFWFTSNIFSENQKIRAGFEFKLGIFKAEKIDGVWTKTEEFPYNSKKQRYNIAHPAISPDGRFMIFSSDMEGGVGASDLWISYLEEGLWTAPKPLGESINTSANELFPYIDDKMTLYFSSNGYSENNGLDVFSVKFSAEESTQTPKRMKAPINTEFDDYGFMIRQDGETGYFSSNRESANDDVYSFQYTYPEFIDCTENYEPSMCYFIEESNIPYIDTLPLLYIWDLGDGTKKNGFTVEHCFQDSGVYNINLNIIDSITGVTFASVNDMELIIELPNQPYITSKDTLIMNEETLFSSKDSEFIWDDVEEWFWEMGNDEVLRGEEIYYAYNEAGIYYITLGALSIPDESGIQNKICVYKEVLVVENDLELEILRETAEAEEQLVLDYDHMEEDEILADEIEESILEEEVESTYFVDILENEEPISIDDPYFDRLRYEITERFEEGDSLYIYSVGQSEEVFALWDIYKEVLDSGYVNAIVKQERIKNFEEETESYGYYYPEAEKDAWNKTITEFANIQFQSNSSRISEESMASLDYIAVMMEIEQEFKLEINAYTDDKGNADYNRTLSERRADAVKRYLIRKGVDPKRLFANGIGEGNPVSDNLTELGRAKNRRVEFRILTVIFKNNIE